MEHVKNLAIEYHKKGNNCAETVFKACNEGLNLGLPKSAVRMAAVMGGGIGRSGCACGALTSACLILGALSGREEPQDKPVVDMYSSVHEFYERWIQRFGVACCRILKNPPEGKSVSCAALMVETADMVSDFVREKGLK